MAWLAREPVRHRGGFFLKNLLSFTTGKKISS